MTCSLCKKPDVDSFETEAGNNAEIAVEVKLCARHLLEYDKDENAFLFKHADKIEDLADERIMAQYGR